MLKLEYSLRFLNPAFLGNAEQQGQWRTPPIKALLRQWWRVAYSADHGHRVNVDSMRAAEGSLFGVAGDKDDESSRSWIRIRLETWSKGAPAQWTPLPPVRHPEVNQGSRDIPSDQYLAFGPILTAKKMAPIQALESTTLRLGFDSRVKSADRLQIISALTLMNLYGTLGGRSRNGWGSFDLAPLDGTPALDPLPVTAVFRDWKEALGCDWPHAMGSGDAPLVWRTQTMTDWRLVMQTLARIKIALRTQFSFAGHATPHRSPLGRHWLAYPVTKHDVQGWKGLRMPNTLRFKVRLDGNDATRPYAVIFHVPCKPTRDFAPDLNAITKVWTSVHAFLDSRDDLSRIPA